MKTGKLAAVAGLVAGLMIAGAAAGGEPPATAKRPVTDRYHGTEVAEDYRWLEDWSDPEVKKWSEAQNAYSRAYLDALPGVKALRERITHLRGAESPAYDAVAVRQGRIFALKSQPPKQQPFIVVLASPDDLKSEKVVVDPNAIDPEGGTSIDFFVPSRDGKLVAVSMSEGGSESGTVYIYETETGKRLPDRIPGVNGGTAGGSVAWNADGTGLFYTRYPREGERPAEDRHFFQQVYFHTLGQANETDRYEIGKDFPRIALVLLDTSDDGQIISASVSNGDGQEFEHFLRMEDGRWVKVAEYKHKVKKTFFGNHESLSMLSYGRAPRGRILTIPFHEPSLDNGEILVKASDHVVYDIVRTPRQTYIHDVTGGVSQLRLSNHMGTPEGFIPVLPSSTVGQMVAIDGDSLLFQNESFLSPPGWYRVDPRTVSPQRTAMSKTSHVSFDGYEVVREMATSKDGTRVPLTILRAKGITLDGSHPTLLYGYGGYGINTMPTFSESRLAWLEQGGVLAMAHIRGGGEYGEPWHLEGNLLKKQNVFDDFHAAMTHVVKAGYCTKDKLGIYGGSNGGLLMGAMLTQHPGDFKAAVSSVGIYDMLRVELSPNGQFNVTEFGTVKEKDQFAALHAYSPYHHVKDGTAYPPVLMMTGANDPRVDPMQSRKMIARLQAAHPAGTFLLRTSANAGHGVGASLNHRVEQDVDRFGFLFHQLGVEYKPVK